MAAACACDVVTEQAAAERGFATAADADAPPAAAPVPGSAASLALAQSYIRQARAAATTLAEQEAALGPTGGGQLGGDPKSDVFLHLLVGRLGLGTFA